MVEEDDEIVIQANKGLSHYSRDLWRFRELFYFLAWRDILVRYKQTVIGVAWALIRPLVTMIVFTVLFGRLAGLSSPEGIPYPLMVFAAMLPWQFFATALSESSGSLLSNANLISKVYFPRIIVPASSMMTSFADFLVTVGMMFLMMIWYRFVPDWRIAALPVFAALAFAAAFGMGLWLCALNVKYRDFRYIVPFILQFGLYLSPVGFSITLIPQRWRLPYACNPMVGVIEGFRWSLLRGSNAPEVPVLLVSALAAGVFFVSGIWYFHRVERTFADII